MISFKLKWAFMIACCLCIRSPVQISYFNFVLQNHWACLNQTWYKGGFNFVLNDVHTSLQSSQESQGLLYFKQTLSGLQIWILMVVVQFLFKQCLDLTGSCSFSHEIYNVYCYNLNYIYLQNYTPPRPSVSDLRLF